VLNLAFRQKVAESIDVISEARSELAPNGTDFGHDLVVV
jgi:hypothetical protein